MCYLHWVCEFINRSLQCQNNVKQEECDAVNSELLRDSEKHWNNLIIEAMCQWNSAIIQ